jgi:hypothetical protein
MVRAGYTTLVPSARLARRLHRRIGPRDLIQLTLRQKRNGVRRRLRDAAILGLILGLTMAIGCTYEPLDPRDPARDAAGRADGAGARDAADAAAADGPATDSPGTEAPDTLATIDAPGAGETAAAVDAPPRTTPDGPPPCTPAPEECNGRDDDCDDVVDDGCPMADALVGTDGTRASSPVFGSVVLDQNVPLGHRCPPGQVVIAFTGHSGYAIDSLGVVCGRLRVKEDRGAMPFRYPLAVEPAQSFDPVGGTSGNVNLATRCPPDFVASGIAAWPSRPASGTCGANYCAGTSAPGCPSNFGLEILCSRYQVQGTPGSFRLVRVDEPPFRTAARVEVDLAPFGFPASKAEYACPANQVVVEASGRYGPWPYDCRKTTVNGLAAACTPPTVQLR